MMKCSILFLYDVHVYNTSSFSRPDIILFYIIPAKYRNNVIKAWFDTD